MRKAAIAAIAVATRRVRLERKNASDDLVQRADCQPLKYADTLLRFAELCRAVGRKPIADQNSSVRQTFLAAGGDDSSNFKRRVLRMMGSPDHFQLRSSISGILLYLLSFGAILITPGIVRTQESPLKQSSDSTNAATKPSEKAQSVAEPKKDETFPIRIFGRALDSNGKRIVGAKIYLASHYPADTRRLAETTTDENGRYKFIDAPLPLMRSEGPPGYLASRFEVFGQAEGYGFAWRPTKAFYLDHKPTNMVRGSDEPSNFDPSDEIVLDLKFPPPAKMSGQIVDDQGQPIPSTRLEIRYAERIPERGFGEGQQFNVVSGGYELEALNERAVVPGEMKMRTTDAEGRFEFAALPPDCRFRITVRPPGFAERFMMWAATKEGLKDGEGKPVETDGMRLTFAKPVEVPVQVLYGDTGRPAPKVLVEAANSEASALPTTDDQGIAKLRLPPGHYQIEMLPEFGSPYLISERNALHLEVKTTSPNAPVIMRLRPAAVLEVEVVDAESEKGLANVDFWKVNAQGRRELHYFRSWEVATRTAHVDRPRTDANGKLRALFEPGKYRVGVGLEVLPRGYSVVESDGQEVDLQPGKPLNLTFHLRKQEVVGGQLQSENGQ